MLLKSIESGKRVSRIIEESAAFPGARPAGPLPLFGFDPFRRPIDDTATVSIRRGLDGTEQSLEEGFLAVRRRRKLIAFRISLAPIEVGLGNDNVFIVSPGQKSEVFPESGQRPVPVGIIGQADDIKGDFSSDEMIEEPLADTEMAPPIDMDHDFDGAFRVDGTDPADARLEKIREVIPLGVGKRAAIGPEHAVGDFVSDFDHVGETTGLLKRGKGSAGIIENLIHQLRMAFSGVPGRPSHRSNGDRAESENRRP